MIADFVYICARYIKIFGGGDCRKCCHSIRVYGGSVEGSVVGYVILVFRRICFFVFSFFDGLEAILLLVVLLSSSN